jgi:cytochrome c-type biogenesis protein CcmH/NrfF
VWYVPGMAYVLGAAYQVAAIRRAQRAADELSPGQTCAA